MLVKMKTILLALMFLLGADTLAAKPVDKKQLNCLAHVVYHEARGESEIGQEAVAYVVVNRSKDPQFPKDFCSVAYQPHQFTNIKLTKPNQTSEAWKNSLKVALTVMFESKDDPTQGAKYFYAQNVVKPRWAAGKQKIVIGNHTFL